MTATAAAAPKQVMLGAGSYRHPHSKRRLQVGLPRTHNRRVVGSIPTGPTTNSSSFRASLVSLTVVGRRLDSNCDNGFGRKAWTPNHLQVDIRRDAGHEGNRRGRLVA